MCYAIIFKPSVESTVLAIRAPSGTKLAYPLSDPVNINNSLNVYYIFNINFYINASK